MFVDGMAFVWDAWGVWGIGTALPVCADTPPPFPFPCLVRNREIGGLSVPLCSQSMYIFKQPKIGGEVGAHQV